MRITSFAAGGQESFGVVVGDGIVDARRHLGDRYASLRELLLDDGIADLAPLATLPPDHKLDEARLLPPINDPAGKILCVGVNYLPHIREMGRERPDYPVIFVRFASSITGHRSPLVRPAASERFDFEGELAVVIGKPARHVAPADAMAYVAGYTCFNDGSIRDYQNHGPQWTPGKNFVASGACGPWIVTTDEAPAPDEMQLTTTLNGRVVQQESVGELCFGIGALIAYISTWTRLEPGDIIATGTPGGVGAGREPPLWMQPGDVVEVGVSGIGTLSNTVVAEDAAA